MYALEAVGYSDQDVNDAARLQVVDHLHPELRFLSVLDPQARNFARAVGQNAQSKLRWRPANRPSRYFSLLIAGPKVGQPATLTDSLIAAQKKTAL
jgi:hypothetical protein